MKHLLIVGARGWGREVYGECINNSAYKNGEFDVKGFLDSKSDAFEGLRGDYPPIICSPEDYEIQEDDIFFVALGDSNWRKHYVELIEKKGGQFLTIISDNAVINPTASIGEGSFICGWSSVSDNVTVGKHVVINGFSILGHDAIVKDYTTLLSYTFLGGYAEVGTLSTMNPKSMIIPHKKVGDNCVVGAGSVVIRNVKDDTHVLGNPAKKIDY